jgi:hypothetical protein
MRRIFLAVMTCIVFCESGYASAVFDIPASTGNYQVVGNFPSDGPNPFSPTGGITASFDLIEEHIPGVTSASIDVNIFSGLFHTEAITCISQNPGPCANSRGFSTMEITKTYNDLSVSAFIIASPLPQGTLASSFFGVEVTLPDGFSLVDLAAPVPEPSTWAMLLIGFAGIGFATCRKVWGRKSSP